MEGEAYDDHFVWDGTLSGGFSIKSVMPLIQEKTRAHENQIWSIIWRPQLQQRIEVFLWLVAHNQLMTSDNRFVRHLTNDPSCAHCAAPEENITHILRDCLAAQLLWNKLLPNNNQNTFFSLLESNLA